ncbi:hypothetical protein HDU98_004155, partial [Podochytrium sp. JEL0797]
MFQAFTFIHNPATRLDPEGNIEFVILLTHNVPQHYRDILLLMGARLLLLPPLIVGQEVGGRYESMYTKLYLWTLEGIYERILLLDGDLFYFQQSPAVLFEFVDERNERLGSDEYFFGACRDWAKDWPDYGPINAGFMLFKPSWYHFWNLLERAGRKEYKLYFEQQLIGRYYFEEGLRWFVELDASFNVMHIGERTEEEKARIIGWHQKFWDGEREFNHTIVRFEMWAEVMQRLRLLQIGLYRNVGITAQDRKLPIVPPVPNDYHTWTRVKSSNVMFDTVSILSSSLAPSEVLASRQEYADRYSQAYHHTFDAAVIQHEGPTIHFISSFNFMKALEAIRVLLETFEWAWFVSEDMLLKQTFLPLHVPLGDIYNQTQKDIIVFQSACNVTDSSVSSFLIHGALRTTLEEFLNETRSGVLGNLGESDSGIWKRFLEAMNGSVAVVER